VLSVGHPIQQKFLSNITSDQELANLIVGPKFKEKRLNKYKNFHMKIPSALISIQFVLQCLTSFINFSGSAMGTLTIRIDDDLERDLDELAKVQHRTKSDLAREMLRKHIAVERFRELRRKALPLAEAAGYVTDEDVFRDIS
jgi:predicted transcriptional regulator